MGFYALYANSALKLNMSVPKDNATNVSLSGSVVLQFDENVKAGSSSCTLNGEVLSGNFLAKNVLFAYSGLDYSTDYTFVVPSGAITDSNNNPYEGLSLHFRTIDKPDVPAKLFDFVVDPKATPINGKVGNTIQSAIDAAPNKKNARVYIFIKNAYYNETVYISADKWNLSLIGEDADSVVVAHSTEQFFQVKGDNIYLENMTIENTLNPDYNQYCQAVATMGNKNIYKNMRFKGHQATQQTGGDRHYFLNCHIHGTIDFIYGSGNTFFDRCYIYLEPRNKMMKDAKAGLPGTVAWDTACVISAGSHELSEKWGMVYHSCTIDGDPSNDGRYSLGRPWHNDAKAVYLNTKMLIKPFEYGWTSMGNPPKRYVEYNSMDKDGNPIDLSGRKAVYIYEGKSDTMAYSPVLTSQEAAQYTLTNVLGGNDGWKPYTLAASPAAPVLMQKGNELSWEKIPYCICYMVRKDHRVVDFVEEPAYTMTSYGDYTIQAIGEYGFSGEPSAVVHYADPSALPVAAKNDLQTKTDYYDLTGRKVSTPEKNTIYLVWKSDAAGRVRTEKMLFK